MTNVSTPLTIVGLVLELFQRHFAQGWRIAHTTLRQFNDLGRDKSPSRIIAQSQVQFPAHAFERERHLPVFGEEQ